MKEGEEYEDYLVEKAKELLDRELEAEKSEGEVPDRKEEIEMPAKTGKKDEKVEEEATSKIPFAWDPREVQHLTQNRQQMSNEEMREFLEKDSEFQEMMEDIDDWKGFSRWEERFMVQNHQQLDPGEVAEELGRDMKEVKLKFHMMGIDAWEKGDRN